MSRRLPVGGSRIDRHSPIGFTFDGQRIVGMAGDTLASALLASGRVLMGRSFKYHRPRGPVAAGVEEPNALVNLGTGARMEPNQRATVVPLVEGLVAQSQNRWPSLDRDVGVINDRLSRFLPAGFYYKMFIHPRPLWKHLWEPIIRRSAGLGRAPDRADADTYEHFNVHVDTAIVGGGLAGLQAALIAGRAGKNVLLMEQDGIWGGRAPVDMGVSGDTVDGSSPADWVAQAVSELAAMPNVTMRLRMMGAGVYDHGFLLAQEDGIGPRHRLWRIRAGHIVTATGAIERPLSFAGNDVPGVMLAGAVRDYAMLYGVAVGDRVVVVTNNDDAYRTALALHRAGVAVPVILDARAEVTGALPERARAAGLRIVAGHGVAAVKGGKGVTGVEVCAQDGAGEVTETIACDAVAMSGGWSPVVHLWSHCGGRLRWDEGGAMFVPDADHPPIGADGQAIVTVIGAAAGAADALADAAEKMGGQGATATRVPEAPLLPVWMMPAQAGHALRSKMFLDYQNDVKVSDVQLAAQEGFLSVEHAKRYTTLGMATDQGKLSNINGLAILAQARGVPIPAVGTTTFRPPYAPISMGAIGGEARGATFQPLRRSPMHDWHAANGAFWEPVGHWRRPYTFRREGERVTEAVTREIVNTRVNVGLLDASTLGKIVVKGPDAGRFLDMLYTNVMSSLPVGKCRYGLMCNEQGFLSDDGVVARLSEVSFLCHTTTGGADRIHAHMEEWLQTEWWDWQVYTANVTEQWGQIAVVGPKARVVLEALGGLDVSKDALPFMGWAAGNLGGFPVRVFRISFSGELSYEIAVPAGQARALWDRLLEAGAAQGIMPYGTEALHVMRAEKGFIMIGDETDGTVIPQDLGLAWAISKKKDDYIGKRGQARSHMTDPNRWQLVGLETIDGSVLPDGAYAVGAGRNANGQRVTQGRVTSTYHSPTLDRGIAMGLVRNGPDRMGEVLDFPDLDGRSHPARICNPVFYDRDGERQNV